MITQKIEGNPRGFDTKPSCIPKKQVLSTPRRKKWKKVEKN
jgi:hypothetical protein